MGTKKKIIIILMLPATSHSGLPNWLSGRDPSAKQETRGCRFSSTTHSSIFAQKILWTEEAGGL